MISRALAVFVALLIMAPSLHAQTASAERTLTTEHFSVTWVEDATHPDAPSLGDADVSGIPDSVEALAAAFEAVWTEEIERWGFQPPPTDGPYRIYITHGDGRGYVRAAPGEDGRSQSSYIVVPPWRVAPEARPSLPSFAAHEFFHAIQYGLDVDEPDWIDEATAAWAQHRFDPDDPTALVFLRDFVPSPRVPLMATNDRREYGAFLFFQFLSERYGNEIMLELWEEMSVPEGVAGAPDRDALGAIEAVLAQRSSALIDEWAIFHLWRRRLDHFERGADYQDALAGSGHKGVLRIDRVRGESCRLTSNSEEGDGLAPLSGDYVRIRPHRRGPSAAQGILNVVGPAGARGFYLLERRNGGVEEHTLAFDEAGVASATVPFGRSSIAGILLGLANGASRGDEQTIAYSLRIVGRSRTEVSPPSGPPWSYFGTAATLRGTVTCGDTPAENALIVVSEDIASTGETQSYPIVTGTDGGWFLRVAPVATATYRVELVDPLLSPTSSEAEHVVGVRLLVSIDVSTLRPVGGKQVRVAGSARPIHPGLPVVVEYRRPGGSTWIVGAESSLDAAGNYDVMLTLPREGHWEVRSRVPSTGDDDHLPGTSGTRLVRVAG